MRKWSALLVAVLLVSLVLSCGVSAAAAENETDWGSVDWTTYDWKNFNHTMWESLSAWLRNEADLEELLYIDTHCSHAAYLETVSVIMGERFEQDPQAMITAIAGADEEARRKHIGSIVAFTYDVKKLTDALVNISLPGPDTDAEHAVLAEMIAYAENMYGIVITNPKTGDPAGIAAALLAASGAGMAILPNLRKKEE